MSALIKNSPVKLQFIDPDHYVMKLKYEENEEFNELILSHITRLLDLPGVQLEVLRGQSDVILKESSKKKSWNLLKKKDNKSAVFPLSEDSLSQIEQLTGFLANHLTKEGLFRKPGNAIRQSQLLTALATGVCINFEKSQFHAHDAACVLKTILGQLSEPLLMPSKHFDAHIQISNMKKIDSQSKEVLPDKGKRIEALQLLLLLLPTANRKVLRGLFDLLYQTAKQQKENKMTAANLSAMFTPHLIWPRSVKATDIHESVLGLNDHLAFMIRHSQKLFNAPNYIREAAKRYFPEDTKTDCCKSPQVVTHSLLATSSAIKRTASARLRYTSETKTETVNALNELYDQVNSLPNSSKKKKIIKNFSKHQEVLKYQQNKTRKRNRTLSGMFRKKALHLTKSKDKESYLHFPQPGDETVPLTPTSNLKIIKPDSNLEPVSSQPDKDIPTNSDTTSNICLSKSTTQTPKLLQTLNYPNTPGAPKPQFYNCGEKPDTLQVKSNLPAKPSSPQVGKQPLKTSYV